MKEGNQITLFYNRRTTDTVAEHIDVNYYFTKGKNDIYCECVSLLRSVCFVRSKGLWYYAVFCNVNVFIVESC